MTKSKKRTDAERIIEAIDIATAACEIISENSACRNCPLRSVCLEETSLADVYRDATESMFREFLGFADDVGHYIDEQDYIADLADTARKGERDE